MFASAFGSFSPKTALEQYYKLFEEQPQEYDYEVEEFEPETAADVQQMLNEARRVGIID